MLSLASRIDEFFLQFPTLSLATSMRNFITGFSSEYTLGLKAGTLSRTRPNRLHVLQKIVSPHSRELI